MSWRIWKSFVHMLKNGNFILESKIAEINKNKNSKRVLYFWYVLESIHKFVIEPLILQWLFVRGPDKKPRRGRIISNFTKGEAFISYDNQMLLGVISQSGPPSCTLQKRLSYPLQFGRVENIPGHSIPGFLFSRVATGWWTVL